MATATTDPMTAEEFAAWVAAQPDDGRTYELDRGRVVEMPPPKRAHGYVNYLLLRVLMPYVEARGGYILTDDVGMLLGRAPDTVLGPDLIVFLTPPPPDESTRWEYVSGGDVPALVVEVRSPSDRDPRILRKVERYHRAGVPLVWVVDSDDRVVTSYRPNEFPRVLDETDELTGNGLLPGFACRVADLFDRPQPPAG